MSIGGRKLEGGIISEIVKHADSKFTALSFQNSNDEQLGANTIAKSLAEKLLDTL